MASWTALTVISGVLVAYAVTADGYPVHKAELNDGGIWITNQAMGAVGRQNVPVAQIDAHVYDGSDKPTKRPTLDVFQDGSAVISVDRATGSLMPIDVAMGQGLEDQRVTAGAASSFFGGGSLGVLDPATGKLWATIVDPDTGTAPLTEVARSTKPITTVGADAIGAAGRDGTVYAASAAAGAVVTLRPAAAGAGFDKPAKGTFDTGREGALAAMTAVGDVPVMLDDQGNLLTPSERLANVGLGAQLQQAGPEADEVVVATPEALLAVPLGGGAPRTLAEVGAQDEVASPVVMANGCTFAAWGAGDRGTLASGCDGGTAATHGFEIGVGAELVFRTNRNQVVLNDEKTGMAWTVTDAAPALISNWNAFREEPEKNKDADARRTDAETDQPPQAEDDDRGARDGRTTVLHVLDNDRIASDGILSIVDVKGVDREGVQVRIAPDRQTLLATVAPGASGTAHFRYTIDDGTEGKSSQDDAAVELRIRTDPESGRPELRQGAKARTFPVTAGGVVEFAVTPDWRDYAYGDPVVVESVKTSGVAEVSTTALGLVRVEVPPGSKGGRERITYDVSTGGASASGSVDVDIVPAGDRTEPAQAESDVVSGEVDAPITVRPLDNDIPGADGSDPGAELVLAGRVAPTGGLEVDTDLESGRVRVTGSNPGTYLLDYNAGFGAARRSAGQIRVDITPKSPDSDRPVATPDTANVHGLSPSIVDVLANDHDPKGRMLVVQNARPSSDDSQLEVAVIDGRWIRVNATDPRITPASQSVTYTISNGANTAEGSVSVTQRDTVTGVANMPVTKVDRATVRAGDTASIPVLDNDSTPSGDPVGLTLDTSGGVPGELEVLPAGSGTAYVSGRQVRFVAPENLEGALDAQIRYVVENTGDPTAPLAVGTAKVHVTAPPSTTNPDQAPTPRTLEGRVVQGEVVTLKLPPIGSDPDGDSVAVTGIQTPPRFGRILAVGANSLTYQAYPDTEGTDEFRYTVSDRWGMTGSASVRVGVVQAGDPQAPLAIDDALVAAPGRTVDVDVLANDLRAPGSDVRVLPLEGAPASARLLSDEGPLAVVAPEDGRTTRVVYTITNGLDESRGVVTVKGRDGFNNPPDVGDIYASPKPGAGSVEVDALAAAYDVDGPEDELELIDVTGDRIGGGATGTADDTAADPDDQATAPVEQVRIEGGKVVIPVTDVGQVFAYRVEDADGAAAAAAIYVPAKPKGAPYLKPGAEITLDPSSSVTADLEDLVIDPEGDPVRLTVDDTISASPASRLNVDAADTTSLKVTALDSEGPGAVMFEVTDREDLDDPTAHHAYISVPVQVGDPAPVITCPDTPVQVPEGGVSRTVDIASVCHVWTADPADAQDLDFTADWTDDGRVEGVDLAVEDGGVRFEASGARRGATGTVAIGAEGFEATGALQVEVVELPAPRLAPIRLDTKAGKAVTVDVAPYLSSPLPAGSRDIAITQVSPVGDASAKATDEGSKLTLTPPEGTHGVMRFRIEVSDVGGSTTSIRPSAVGEVQLAVVDRPDAPTNLRVGPELLSKTVALTWATPDNNGERITGYEVSWNGGKSTCPGSPCRVTGLSNGETYSFTVKARNAVGWSDASKPVTGEPDAFTGPVQNPRVLLARNNSIRVAWDKPAACDCSAVEKYRVSAPGMGIRTVDASVQQMDVPATNGENTTVTIVPLNAKGVKENNGPTNTVTGVAAGAPPAPGKPSVTGANVAGDSQKTVTVSWSPVAANGPDPVAYEVSRGGTVVCGWQVARTCTDAGIANDGTTYTYTVRAKNAEADSDRERAAGGAAFHTSSQSPGTSIEASAQPAAPVINSITPTGNNGEARIDFTAGPSHGASNTVTCTVGSCSWSGSRGGGSGTMLVTGLANSPTNVALRACNGSRNTALACKTGSAKQVSPYGDIGAVSLSTTVDGRYITWTAHINPNGKSASWIVERNWARGGPGDWTVVGRGTTGTGQYASAPRREYLSDNARYYYRLTVSDPGRTTRTHNTSAHTEDVAGPTANSTQGDPCGSNCWHVLTRGVNFAKPSMCSVHAGGPAAPGARIGASWSQSEGWEDSGVRLGAGRPYHIRCANGAISRSYTFSP